MDSRAWFLCAGTSGDPAGGPVGIVEADLALQSRKLVQGPAMCAWPVKWANQSRIYHGHPLIFFLNIYFGFFPAHDMCFG